MKRRSASLAAGALVATIIVALSGCTQSAPPPDLESRVRKHVDTWNAFAVRHMFATDSLIHSAGFESLGAHSASGAGADTPYSHPAAHGMRGLEAVLQLPKVRHWLNPGGPDPEYELWVHPSKLMGVLAEGMVFLHRHSDDPVVSRDALGIATAAAEFLLTLREPPGAALANWPPSYWDGVDGGEHPTYMSQIMTLYPAEAAMAFLDLYDATNEDRWWNATLEIAATYAERQLPNGTWPLLMRRSDASPVTDKMLVPVTVINFFDRLSEQYDVQDYVDLRARAYDWILRNPLKTYAWDAQYEDTRPRATYKNLSHREAAGFARLLLSTSQHPDTLEIAKDLLAFVEDQFIVWSHEDEMTKRNWFKDGSKWNGALSEDPAGGKDWFLPATLEQFAFRTPIAGATSNMIHAFCTAFEATGETIYRDKARALTRSIVAAQQHHGGGEIPTHLRQTLPEESWLNNSVYAARTLVDGSCL